MVQRFTISTMCCSLTVPTKTILLNHWYSIYRYMQISTYNMMYDDNGQTVLWFGYYVIRSIPNINRYNYIVLLINVHTCTCKLQKSIAHYLHNTTEYYICECTCKLFTWAPFNFLFCVHTRKITLPIILPASTNIE